MRGYGGQRTKGVQTSCRECWSAAMMSMLPMLPMLPMLLIADATDADAAEDLVEILDKDKG